MFKSIKAPSKSFKDERKIQFFTKTLAVAKTTGPKLMGPLYLGLPR